MTATQDTRASLKAGLDLVMLFANAIREVGQIPEGTLYAQAMVHMDLATFESAMRMLERCELVTRQNHLLTWIGPVKAKEAQ